MMDPREELINEITISLMDRGLSGRDIKDILYIHLDAYEILPRETALAELKEDRNERILRDFLVAKTVKGCTGRTIEAYKNYCTQFLRDVGKTIDDITAQDIRLYMAKRKMKGVSEVSIGNEVRAVSSMFTYLTAQEVINKNPMLKVETIKKRKVERKAFTEDEIEKIRMAFYENEMYAMIVEVLLSTGCRITELINIRLDEIDGDRVLVHGKGNKDRYVYLNAKAKAMTERYMNKRNDMNPYLLPRCGISGSNKKKWWENPEYVGEGHMDGCSVGCQIRRIAEKQGIKAHPHKFRRTCATLALRRGMPIEQVSKMLGHENINTTQIYLDMSEDDFRIAHKKYVV